MFDKITATITKTNINKVEIILNRAIRFISNLKGRADSVSATREQLGLDSLKEGRKKSPSLFVDKGSSG